MRTIWIALIFGTLVCGCKKKESTAEMSPYEKQQSEALMFVKQCVRQVKHQDIKVLSVVTDASTLFDVEAELKKQGSEEIDWDDLFGKLSELTDDQINHLDEEVLILKHPMRATNEILTDKRNSTEKKVEGLYMRFEAEVAPQFRSLFKDQETVGFGVYIIEGQKYWEPFNW